MSETRALYQAGETEAVAVETAGRLRDRARIFLMAAEQIEDAWKSSDFPEDEEDAALAVQMLRDKAAALETDAHRQQKASDGR
jgi:hypothetical protein